MKSWGLNPTNNEVQDIMNDIDDSGDGEFDFPEFIEIMANRMKVNRNYTYQGCKLFRIIGINYCYKWL